MLRSAIATGMVDCVLPLAEIPQVLQRYKPQHRAAGKSDEHEKLELLDAILDVLAMRNSNNFSAYKKTTLLRRAERRMGMNHLDSLADYLRFLQANPNEADELGRDMLIGVSSFFRDPEAFEELGRTVIAPLVRQRENNAPLRVWIPGCSTGEEAYSIAILLLEELDAADKNCPLQVFATDVDGEAVKFARNGIYPHSIAADVTEPRLVRFFTKQDSTYQISKRLRESVVFSLQNLLTEPPFSRLDLISCRNLLIYIEPAVQRKLLSLFAFALSAGGFLFLGKSDGMASQSPLFVPVSSKWRIYRRTTATPALPGFPYAGGKNWESETLPKLPSHPNVAELNQQILLEHFRAAAVLINEHGGILHFFGTTGKYLEHPTGEANLNLLNMVEARLSAKLRLALRKLANDNEPPRSGSRESSSIVAAPACSSTLRSERSPALQKPTVCTQLFSKIRWTSSTRKK